MGITLVIVGGIVLTTFAASFFDYLGKSKKGAGKDVEKRLSAMEKRFAVLEDKLNEKDERINQLESEISFVNKLIENRTT